MIKLLRKTIYKNFFPLHLSDFRSVTTHSDCPKWEYNKKRITYFDKYNKEVGYIEYKPNIGKICLFFITNEKYRNRGLGKQILNFVLDDIKTYQTKRVWLVTAKCSHPFWEGNGFTYTESPDFSVSMHGYTREL